MTYHYTDIPSEDVNTSSRTTVSPVLRWIEQGGAPATAAAEVHSLLTGGQPAAAADRAERLHAGLYQAWSASWGIRPGARLELMEALNGIELEAIKVWLAASGAAAVGTRQQLQRLLHLVASCRVVLSRIRGRRPGTRRSARDMSECHPSRPEEAARAARANAGYPAYYTRIDACDLRDRYARDLARIRHAEDALADEVLDDDLGERDVRHGDALAAFRAQVMPVSLGWNPDVLLTRKSKRKVDEFGWEQFLEDPADAEYADA
ncbi:MAG: hypothetical protein DI601_00200 [Azospirillum brasilense]|nr:MAG: hypothetical protein DI601_00200 [Azospirillum brasilense]